MHGNFRGQKIIHHHQSNILLSGLKMLKTPCSLCIHIGTRGLDQYLVGEHAKELWKKGSWVLVKVHVVAGKNLLKELRLF